MGVLNEAAFNWIHTVAGRSGLLDGLVIFFAEYLGYALIAAFFALIFYQNGPRRKFYLFAEGALAIILARGIITEAIRFLYYNQRPFVFYGFTPLIDGSASSSFPSGHASWFFALAMAVWYANRTWGWWYLILAVMMGVARIYVGVHWPLDIIGGAAIGIASGVIIHRILRSTEQALPQFHEREKFT